MSRPVEPAIKSLPVDVQSMLVQDYSDLRIILQLTPSFVLEGKRRDSGEDERIEATELTNVQLVKRMRRDFDICASDSSSVVRAVDSFISGNHTYFRYCNHGPSLYQTFVHQRPYIGGEEGLDMLNSHLPPIIHRDTKEIIDILQAAVGICTEVEKLHNKQIVHSGINPHTTFITNKIISLRSAFSKVQQTIDEDEGEEFENTSKAQNMVMYLSPEATGRTNRCTDFRSDIYSIGCTIHELLVGRPPFVAPDTLSLIHRHLTLKPKNINTISNMIPIQLGDVLLKCLEKAPDARYSSIAGLKHDLHAICDLISENQSLESFELGSLDDLLRFNVPKMLCGREHEYELLRGTLRQISSTDHSAIVSITGVPGVGKSQLVAELVIDSPHFIAASKCLQYRRNTTYSAITNAVQTLVRQILTHNQRDIRNWREKLLADQDKIDILFHTIPELLILLGEQPRPQQLADTAPHETRRKIHVAFIHLLRVFSRRRGLIFCQDDAQWANQAELDLVVDLVTHVPSLLMILARRPVDADDIVHFALNTARARNVEVVEIELDNLREVDVKTLITKSVQDQTSPELDSLSHFVYGKTLGNPFLVSQFLQTLHRTNKIYLDTVQLRWRFNIKAFKDEDLTNDIIDVISLDMRQMPKATRSLVATAAALGLESFTVGQLAKALSQSEAETSAQLQVAVDRNIFRVLDNVDIIVHPIDGRHEERYSFLHDKTQESAYELLSTDEQSRAHYTIATKLLNQTDTAEPGAVFLLANQFNRCLKLLNLEESKTALNCNLDAGHRSLKSGDPVSAQYYFEVAEYVHDQSTCIGTALTGADRRKSQIGGHSSCGGQARFDWCSVG